MKFFLFCLLVFSQFSNAQIVYGNAVQFQGRTLSPLPPNNNQTLVWNSTFVAWVPGMPSGGGVGTVTSVTAGTGATGGTITTTGTIGVDVGVTANKIVQLTSTGQYPAVDGFLITNLNTPASGANTALSNLAAVGINTDLIFNEGATATLKTRNETGANSQTLIITSGIPNTTNFSSGQVQLRTAAATGSGNSGSFLFQSGTSVNGNTGGFAFNILAPSGSGTRGQLAIQDGSDGIANQYWKSTDTSGNGHWSNISQLQGVAIATTSPTNAQLLTFNSTLNQWNPQTSSGGGGTPTLTNLTNGTALAACAGSAGAFQTYGTVTLTTGTWLVYGQATILDTAANSGTLLPLPNWNDVQLCLSTSTNACSGSTTGDTLITNSMPATSSWSEVIVSSIITVGSSTPYFLTANVTLTLSNCDLGAFIHAIQISP